MTREEQIHNQATNYGYAVAGGSTLRPPVSKGFFDGAKWADANQPNPWIRVEERLPYINRNSYSDCVLTIDENQNIVVAFYSFYRGGWIRAYGNDDIDDSIIQNDITHWMPIPELPKEEKK